MLVMHGGTRLRVVGSTALEQAQICLGAKVVDLLAEQEDQVVSRVLLAMTDVDDPVTDGAAADGGDVDDGGLPVVHVSRCAWRFG